MISSAETQPSNLPQPAGKEDLERGTDTDALRVRVRGTNINEQTLLATDFLNHFNGIVMTLEMVSDMPELLEEAKAWQPKTYQDHFRDSVCQRRRKKGPLVGCELVPVVHGRAARATRRALDRLTRRRARVGPVGPRGQAWAGWSVQLAVGV